MAQLTPAQHERDATIAPSGGYPRGRFPVPDKAHARLALAMVNRAKGLSPSQEATIRSKAKAKLGL